MSKSLRCFRYVILVVDLLCVTLSLFIVSKFYLGTELSVDHSGMSANTAFALMLSSSLWSLLFFALRLDGFDNAGGMLGTAVSLALGIVILVVLVASGTYLADRTVPRLVLVWASGIAWMASVGSRWVFDRLLLSHYAVRTSRRAVIVGEGRVATEVAHKIMRHPELRCRVVGFFSPNSQQSKQGHEQQSLSSLNVPKFLQCNQITDLILVFEPTGSREIGKLVERCRANGIRISLVPNHYELYGVQPRFVRMEGVPLVTMDEHEPNGFLQQVKVATEPMVAIALLTATLPVMSIAALYVWRRYGKAFMSQERCGKDGALFRLYRLNVNRDVQSFSGIDYFLMRTSLTELPQLWNVVRGEMSLVGPRPESPVRVEQYSEWHRKRLAIKPGMTGLAQVHGLRDESSSEDKTRFDLEYIVNWSTLLDTVLKLRTISTLAQRLWRPRRPQGLLRTPVITRPTFSSRDAKC